MKYYTTQQGQQKLTKKIIELENKLKKIREEKSLAYTRDGDGTHDNPHYQHLKNQEGVILSKINEYSNILSDLELIEISNRDMDVVRLGSIVTCSIFDSASKETIEKIFEIVGYFEDYPEKNKISYLSPIGKSLLGLSENESADVKLPQKVLSLTVLSFHKEFPIVK